MTFEGGSMGFPISTKAHSVILEMFFEKGFLFCFFLSNYSCVLKQGIFM